MGITKEMPITTLRLVMCLGTTLKTSHRVFPKTNRNTHRNAWWAFHFFGMPPINNRGKNILGKVPSNYTFMQVFRWLKKLWRVFCGTSVCKVSSNYTQKTKARLSVTQKLGGVCCTTSAGADLPNPLGT
jgi:hypothetical protein